MLALLREQKVKGRTLELEEALEHNKLLLDSVGDGIYGLDMDGKATFVNPAVCALLNYGNEELLGQSMHDIAHHSYPSGKEFLQADCHIHNTQIENGVQRTDKECFWRKDGSHFCAEHTSSPIYKDNQLQRRVVTIRDISDRQIADKAKREFVSTVSHELRTSLTAIKGGLGLVMGGVLGEVPEAIREVVRLAYNNSDHLHGLIGDLLDAGKIKSGNFVRI